MEEANFLKGLRLKKGLRQKDVAIALGFSVQVVSTWEKGASFPDAYSWKRISDLYDITLSALLYEDLNKGGIKVDGEFISSDFADRMVIFRKKEGLTQVEAAERLGINFKTLGSFEKGKSVPSRKVFLSICDLYGLIPEELYFGITLEKEKKSAEEAEKIVQQNASYGTLWKRAVFPSLLLIVSLFLFLPRPILDIETPIEESSDPMTSYTFDLPISKDIDSALVPPDCFRSTLHRPSGEVSNVFLTHYGCYPNISEIDGNYIDEENGTIQIFQSWSGENTRSYGDRDFYPMYKEIPIGDRDDVISYRFRFLPNGNEIEILNYSGEYSEDFYIPDAITGYPVMSLNFAFPDEANIKSLFIPDSVTTIKRPLFFNNRHIEHIQLSDNLTRVESQIVYNKNNLECRQLGNASYLGSSSNPYLYCMYDFDGNDVHVHEGAKILAAQTVTMVYGDVYLPSSLGYMTKEVRRILQSSNRIFLGEGNPFFYYEGGCLIERQSSSLILLDDGVTSLPNWIVNVASYSLTKFQGSVLSFPFATDIEDNACGTNSFIERVEIGGLVNHVGHNAFSSCYKLSHIEVDPSNSRYCSADGRLLSKDGRILFVHPPHHKDTTFLSISAPYTAGRKCFSNCDRLINITIQAEDLENESFLPEECIYCCSSLKEIGLNVNTLSFRSVYDCPSLRSIHFGKALKFLDEEAIVDCPSLNRIVYDGSEKEWARVYRQTDALPNQEIEMVFLG